MRVLILSAHPDDELLGVGGTMIKHIDSGDEVFVHLLTDGHTSRLRDPNKAGDISPEVVARVQSAERAARKIGFQVEFGPFDDQRLDTVPAIELVQCIEDFARHVKPDVVYMHHKGDVNIDHQVVFRAGMTVFRSVGNAFPHRLLAYETMSSTEWCDPSTDAFFMPNVFIDISKQMDRKMEALREYDQEMRPYPHPRSYEGVRIAAQRWGTVIGTPAAEAFVLLREVVRN